MLDKIKSTLIQLFDKYRIIFWFDNNGEVIDLFNELEIANVEKIIINNNEFNIKYRVLYQEKNQKFLIYSKNHLPENEENMLLDLVLANYVFYADTASIVITELGLNPGFRAFVDKNKKFFKSQKRKENLKNLLELNNDTETDILFKMIAVTLKCEPDIEDMIFKVIIDNKLEELKKLELEKDFWNFVKNRFNYISNIPTINDFVYKLILTHFYYFVDISKQPLNRDAFIFVKSWMDSKTYSEMYIEYSNKTFNDLNLESVLSEISAEKLIECDTFENCDKKILLDLRDKISNNTISYKEIENIIETRKNKLWFDKYKYLYDGFYFGTRLIQSIEKEEFKISNFESAVRSYTKNWHNIDWLYRRFIVCYHKTNHSDILKELYDNVEKIYFNRFLKEVNDNFQNFIKSYGDVGSFYQRSFFSKEIKKYIKNNKKVFIIISDALRYECGLELSKIISYLKRFEVEMSFMLASVPTFTQLGMAALLPHEKLEIKENGNVYCDEVLSAGINQRNNILKKNIEQGAAIQAEDFLNLNNSEAREFAKNHNVIYIFHNEIDATGDNSKNENNVFEAVDSAFATIEQIIKKIANANGNNIILTADHGFLYTESPTKDTEFCSVDNNGEILKKNRRFVIGKNLKQDICTEKFTASQLRLEGNLEFLIPKSINKIRIQGSGNRFVHGGMSLQELIIPLLKIKRKRTGEIEFVKVNWIPVDTITTSSVTLSFYQADAVGEKKHPITLKIGLYSEDGKILTNEEIITFDSSDDSVRNREKKVKFSFKKEASKYYGKDIKLVLKKVIEGTTETPVYAEHKIKYKAAFFDDFDGF